MSSVWQLPLESIEPPSATLDAASKRMGRVLTPEALTDSLCRWAIRSPRDVVLDLGVGEGAFALAAFERLRALGADAAAAAVQVHGAERDPVVYARAQAAAMLRLQRQLPNVVCADFYDTLLPLADAVVGNPPYIRRHHQGDLARVRAASGAQGATGLTDSYCFFLLRACRALRKGGRIAVIVSASWLDMNYGRELKRLLIDQFRPQLVLAFDGRVFSNALVKSVVILAEKAAGDGQVSFARLSHTSPLGDLDQGLDALVSGRSSPDAVVARVPKSDLSPALPWSLFLKAPEVYAALASEAPLTPLKEVAESRIGLQTFAKRFYIMTRTEAERWGIEPEFLLPVALSPRELRSPVIDDLAQLRHVVLRIYLIPN